MNESSPEDRPNLLVAQIGSYVGNEGAFGNGAAYKGTNRNGDVSMSGRGWWMFGGDTPELQFIAITLLGLSPSSCPVEQSFSQQNKFTHSFGTASPTARWKSSCFAIGI
jgi:hypothetical protein